MATRNQQTRVFDAAATCALFDGDAAAVRELVALVVGDLPVYVRKLQASLASGDHASAARDAHRLKGTVLNVHAAPLAALCEAAEQAARQQDATLAGLVDRLAREADVLLAALTAWDQTLADAMISGSSDPV